MSCLIQSPENTAAIADYIASLLNHDFSCNGMTCPESLQRELDRLNCFKRGCYERQAIYKALTDLNVSAYNGRYNENATPRPYKTNSIYRLCEHDHGIKGENGFYKYQHFIVAEWHYKILKMIQFFIYQCSEDNTDSTPLYKGMTDLEHELANFIVENSLPYVMQEWG